MVRREIIPRQIRKDGKLVWVVRMPKDLQTTNDAKMRFFGDDEKAAIAQAKTWRDARMSVGGVFLKLPSITQSAILNGVNDIGGENLVKAIQLWRGAQPETVRTTRKVVEECLIAKEKAGLRKHSLQTLKCSLNNLAAAVGDKPIHEVTSDDGKKWAYENEWAPKTRLNYIKDAITMFKYALNHQYVTRNPFVAVPLPKIDQVKRSIFHVKDVKRFLATAKKHDPALLGVICPDLFGGIRPEESKRITKKDVKHGQIDLEGASTKKRKWRVVKMNETLKAWLAVKGVEFGGKNIVKRMRKIRELAKVDWGHDILRHTFCSFACHKFGKRVTAELACTSESLLDSTYVNLIKDDKEVEKFWALRPK